MGLFPLMFALQRTRLSVQTKLLGLAAEPCLRVEFEACKRIPLRIITATSLYIVHLWT
jgi:hypothetical protein